MSWASQSVLWALALVPVLAVVAVVLHRRAHADLARLASAYMVEQLVSANALRQRAWAVPLAPVVLAAGVLAWAGPRLGYTWQQQTIEGVSIVAVLDVSQSMDATDVSPSRLIVARRELRDFSELVRNDAMGLVLFAQGAWARIPLTTDLATWRWALDDSDSGTIRAQGTSLSGALTAAVKLLGAATGTGKAIVVVSDGESHDDEDDLQAALGVVTESGARLYVLGVGTPEGAPVPEPGGGLKKDASGAVVISKLNEGVLRGIAEATGGAYVRAVPGDSDVRALYEGEIRGKLEASERGVRRDKLWNEAYQWPLAAALLGMVVAAGLGVGRRQ